MRSRRSMRRGFASDAIIPARSIPITSVFFPSPLSLTKTNPNPISSSRLCSHAEVHTRWGRLYQRRRHRDRTPSTLSTLAPKGVTRFHFDVIVPFLSCVVALGTRKVDRRNFEKGLD